MFENWQIRGLLGLTQLDVSLATGITVQRISLEERGLITFNEVEQAAIEGYFGRKLRAYGYNPASASTLEVALA